MSPLELALTVFVWGAVVAGTLLTLSLFVYLDALTKRTKAQAETERSMHRTP